jgi:hypothetical protein
MQCRKRQKPTHHAEIMLHDLCMAVFNPAVVLLHLFVYGERRIKPNPFYSSCLVKADPGSGARIGDAVLVKEGRSQILLWWLGGERVKTTETKKTWAASDCIVISKVNVEHEHLTRECTANVLYYNVHCTMYIL